MSTPSEFAALLRADPESGFSPPKQSKKLIMPPQSPPPSLDTSRRPSSLCFFVVNVQLNRPSFIAATKGKTFTMGTDGGNTTNSNSNDELSPPSAADGFIARAVQDLFQIRSSLPSGPERVKVEMSYLEIYNEQAIDLLSDDPSSTTLQVRDSKTEGFIVQNLKSFVVSSPADVRRLMVQASAKRATGSTQMNAVSSRSHAICTLNVTISPLEDGGDDENVGPNSSQEMMRAKLTLVDLAGSERIKKTGAEGAKMKEGININKGLFVLGKVVSALSELGQMQGCGKKSNAHIPYRDSKLTRLLQQSLGGNSRMVMIACISPAEPNAEESINTLRYAERTRNIKNSAVRNVVTGGLSAGEAAELRKENQQLKLELAQIRDGSLPSGTSSIRTLPALASAQAVDAENEERIESHASEALEATLWQAKYENLLQIAKEQGIDLTELLGAKAAFSRAIVEDLASVSEHLSTVGDSDSEYDDDWQDVMETIPNCGLWVILIYVCAVMFFVAAAVFKAVAEVNEGD